MHQWWGDNVSEADYNLTFFKEGLATLGEYFFEARRTRRPPAGGSRRGVRAEPGRHASTPTTRVPTAVDGRSVRPDARPRSSRGRRRTPDPGISYIALRRILGPANFNAALQQIQATYRQGSITEPQLEAAFASFLPRATGPCKAQLNQFFTQWWDTVYPPGGGANRPQITGPGLDGGGFHC